MWIPPNFPFSRGILSFEMDLNVSRWQRMSSLFHTLPPLSNLSSSRILCSIIWGVFLLLVLTSVCWRPCCLWVGASRASSGRYFPPIPFGGSQHWWELQRHVLSACVTLVKRDVLLHPSNYRVFGAVKQLLLVWDYWQNLVATYGRKISKNLRVNEWV